MALDFNANSAIYQSSQFTFSGDPRTFYCRLYITGNDNEFPFGVYDGNSSPYTALMISNLGKIRYRPSKAAATLESSSALGSSVWHSVAATSRAANDHELTLNGSSADTDATSVTLDTSALTDVVIGGKYNFSSFSQQFNGYLAECAIWDAGFTAAELVSLTAGDYSPDFFYPESLVFYSRLIRTAQDLVSGVGFSLDGTPVVVDHPPVIYPSVVFLGRPAAGGAAYSLSADAGSYTITGTAAGLEWGRAVDATTAAYAITGTTAGLERGFAIDVEAGSYTITGTAADLEYGYALDAAAGSYTITGTAAGLEHDKIISADAGSYTITGASIDLRVGFTISADAGSYTITGTTADLEYGRVVAVAAGSYTITGTDVTLTHESGATISAEAGSYVLSGTAAGLEYGSAVDAEAGSYALTGTEAGLEYGRVISAESGSYALAGGAVSLGKAWLLGANAGAYALTGLPATLDYSAAWQSILTADVQFGQAVAADMALRQSASADVELHQSLAADMDFE